MDVTTLQMGDFLQRLQELPVKVSFEDSDAQDIFHFLFAQTHDSPSCVLFIIFSHPNDPIYRTALQKAKIPANIQTQIVSFLVLSQKQASLRYFYFRILVGREQHVQFTFPAVPAPVENHTTYTETPRSIRPRAPFPGRLMCRYSLEPVADDVHDDVFKPLLRKNIPHNATKT